MGFTEELRTRVKFHQIQTVTTHFLILDAVKAYATVFRLTSTRAPKPTISEVHNGLKRQLKKKMEDCVLAVTPAYRHYRFGFVTPVLSSPHGKFDQDYSAHVGRRS